VHKYSSPLVPWDYWPWFPDSFARALVVGRNSHDPWRVLDSDQPSDWYGMAIPAPHFYAVNLLGAEPPRRIAAMPNPSQRSGLLADVAPVVAPATGGLTAHLDLDRDQQLHAQICVDGKCYQASIDLGPAIETVMARLAQWHREQHSMMTHESTMVSGEVMLSALDQAVGAAGNALIGVLVDRHISVACAGWLDDIGNAVKGIGSGVSHAVTGTLKTLKGPITVAATAAATAYGGPAGGALAAQLVGPIVDQVAGKDAPQAVAAEQAAKTNTAVAQALSTAKNAVAHTVAAYHVRETAKAAAAGHPASQQQISQVVQHAQTGDPVAQSATDVIAQTIMDRAQHSQWGANIWQQLTGRGPATVSSGWD
jgi:hypothetical protein